MFAGLGRLIACWLLFGVGAEALTPSLGNTLAVIASAAIAIYLNTVWKDQQRQRFAREHREAVIADEELRRQVRSRRADRRAV